MPHPAGGALAPRPKGHGDCQNEGAPQDGRLRLTGYELRALR